VTNRILIAGGDISLLECMERILVNHGYQVFTFFDGIDALTGVVGHRPDMILVETSMPRLNAYQFCYLIKRNVVFRPVPVTVISDTDGLNERARGRSLGATYQLVKPFGDQELLEITGKCRNFGSE